MVARMVRASLRAGKTPYLSGVPLYLLLSRGMGNALVEILSIGWRMMTLRSGSGPIRAGRAIGARWPNGTVVAACFWRVRGWQRAVGTERLMACRGHHGEVIGFGPDQSGATMVEFALVVAPFVVILFGLLELALLFIINVSLSLATESFAGQLRTGQLQAPGVSASSSSGVQIDLADAKTLLCNGMLLLPLATCIQQVQIDVRPLTTFQQTVSTTPVSGSTFSSANLCFYSGNAGSIVEVRAYYLYPIVDPLLLTAFSPIKTYTSSSGSASGYFYPITTTQVFKAENYSSGSNTGAGC